MAVHSLGRCGKRMKLGIFVDYGRAHLELAVELVQRAERLA
jgi:hypothetical protein